MPMTRDLKEFERMKKMGSGIGFCNTIEVFGD
jgi:hypothetical protein